MKFLIPAVALLSSSVTAWWNNGHMITARVAYDYLQEVAPSVLPLAEAKLQALKDQNSHEGNHSFVECATFADDIKKSGFAGATSAWHFDDIPYMDGIDTEVLPEHFNVTWSVGYMKEQLMKPVLNDTGVKRSLGDSFNIRMLIHFTGDMH